MTERGRRGVDAVARDAVVANLPILCEPVERLDPRSGIDDRGRRAVQLEEIETIGAQAMKAAFHGAAKVRRRKVLRERAPYRARQVLTTKAKKANQRTDKRLGAGHELSLRRQNISRLGRDDDLVAAMPEYAPEKAFTLALTVDVRRVEEIDAPVEGRREEVEEVRRISLEDAPDTSATKTELRDVQIRAAET